MKKIFLLGLAFVCSFGYTQSTTPKRDVLGSAGQTSIAPDGSSCSWNVGEPFIGTAISPSGKILTQGFEQPDLLFQSCFDFYVSHNVDCNDVSGNFVVIFTLSGGYPSQPNNGYLVTSSHIGGFNGIIYGSFVDGPFPSNTGYSYHIQVLDNPDCYFDVTQEIVECSTTPITLLNFDGIVKSDGNSLFWDVANEINCDFYELHRSTNGIDFMKIYATNCHGDANAMTTHYDYLDESAPWGYSYYQLKQFDTDGTFVNSDIVTLYRSKNENNNPISFGVFPNPASEIVNMNFDPELIQNFTLNIVDVSGRLLFIKTATQELDGSLSLNISHLPDGIYLFTFYDNLNELIQTTSVRKIK